MANAKIPVLITAVGGGGVGEQILKALTIANNQDPKYHIIAGDMNPYCPQFKMADEAFCLPSANDENFMDALNHITKTKNCLALFPGCEPDLARISKNRDALDTNDLMLPINPTDVITTCMDKTATGKILTELGFNPPQYIEAETYEELEHIDWFPVVIKPTRGSGGSAHSYIAQNQEELRYLTLYLKSAVPNQAFIVQEYVGDENSEYTVGILHDMDGHYINSIAVHRQLKSILNVRARYKNNTGRTDLGETLTISSGISHGFVGKFPEVTDRCRDLAKAIGARCAINIQLRLVDGEIKVFEINPRFSGTTSIRAMMGYNEPDTLVRKHILGEDIQTDFAFEEGMILRSLVETALPNTPAPKWNSDMPEKKYG